MKALGILKEQSGDLRVCVNPLVVKKMVKELELTIFVEKDAGLGAGFSNEEYEKSGAQVLDRNEVVNNSEILLFINQLASPLQPSESKILISILNPLFHFDHLKSYSDPNLTVYSLDLMPRTSKAQAMDVLSSMASLSGYKAVLKAADLQSNVLPMFTTAAGTVRPAKALIIGAGVAGLQAIATAKRLGAVVDAFDVRKSAGEEVRSLGANFIEVEGAVENEQAGGYAVEQTEDFLNKQKALIDKYVAAASIVITTANIPGKKAPILVQKESVAKMNPGSVIIDLASEQGGNCELTEDAKTVVFNGVKIIGDSFLSRELATTASQLLATNYYNFLKYLLQFNGPELKVDPILGGCIVVEKGQVVNERVLSIINSK
jgi:H+-translocating NAD(P) transhydrogenase subunit alpha